jgi:hypothetical protein
MTWPLRATLPLFAIGCLASRPAPCQSVTDLPESIAHVASGGSWTFGTARGHYRLIIVNASVTERDSTRTVSRLVIQWIETSGPRPLVRTTVESTVIGEPWSLGPPVFQTGGTRTVVFVAGRDHHSGQDGHWVVTLGPPGQYGVSAPRPAR